MSSAVDATGRAKPDLFSLVYGVLFRPGATFALPLADAPGALAALVALVAVVLGFDMAGAEPGTAALGVLASLGWLVFGWGLLSGVLFLVTRPMTRTREAGLGDLAAALAATYAPLFLLGPVGAMASWGKPGLVIAAVGGVAVLLWWLRLVLLAVRGSLGLTAGQGVLALVAGELLVVAIPTTWLVLWVLTLGLAIAGS